MIKSAFLPVSGIVAIISLALTFSSCSQQPEPSQLTAQMLKEQYKDTKRIKKRDERGIKYASYWLEAMKINPATGTVDINDVYKARLQALQMRNNTASKQASLNLQWESLGPDNVGGRTRTLMIDKDNSNRLFAGSVTGGLFVSNDGALSWTEHPQNDEFLSTSISSIVQAINGDIYIGTGETFVYTQQNTSGHIGGGIYKSVDGGNTFTLLPSTQPVANSTSTAWAYVSRLATDPFDANKIFAAINGGLYYSTNGGDTWNVAAGIANADLGREARDVRVNSQGVVVAEINRKYYRSGDGVTFQLISGTNGFPSTNVRRIEFAVSSQDPNYVYAAICNNNGGLRGIYRSVDAGVNWLPYSQENSSVFNPLGEQGEYDIALAVNPNNKDEVVIGGQLELWKGGLSVGWDLVAYWAPESPTNPYYVHADMHFAVYDPKNPTTLYICTDGGVFKSLNANQQFPTFTPRNKNYITTQFYHMAANPSGEVIAGAQDNGTVYINYRGNTVLSGLDVRGGDGGYCAISQLNPNIVFSEVQYGALARSLNRGGSFGSVWDDYATSLGAGSQTFSQFIAPYDLWEERTEVIDSIVLNPTTQVNDTFKSNLDVGYLVFGAVGRIMFTNDALAAGGIYWYTRTVAGNVSAVAPAPDGDFYVGTSGGNLYLVSGLKTATYNKATNTATGVSVTLIRSGNQWSGTTARYITSIGVDPQDAGHIVVTFGGYGSNVNIFESDDARAGSPVFTSIQGDLPNMPVYAAVIDRYNPDNIIAGTDFGLWSSADRGASWTQETNGIFNTPVYSVTQRGLYNEDCYVLYVASYGRGMFRSTTLTAQNNSSCNLLSGIIENKPVTLNRMSMYPNPASEQLFIDLDLAKTSNVTVRVIDLLGREMLKQSYGSRSAGKTQLTTNVASLPAGVYVVAVETALGLDTRQIVIAK